jgi:hypothetical protein
LLFLVCTPPLSFFGFLVFILTSLSFIAHLYSLGYHFLFFRTFFINYEASTAFFSSPLAKLSIAHLCIAIPLRENHHFTYSIPLSYLQFFIHYCSSRQASSPIALPSTFLFTMTFISVVHLLDLRL